MMRLFPDVKAEGALTSARRVNRYAAHMVPTITVIFRPTLALKRPTGPGPWSCVTAAATVGGPALLRCLEVRVGQVVEEGGHGQSLAPA